MGDSVIRLETVCPLRAFIDFENQFICVRCVYTFLLCNEDFPLSGYILVGCL